MCNSVILNTTQYHACIPGINRYGSPNMLCCLQTMNLYYVFYSSCIERDTGHTFLSHILLISVLLFFYTNSHVFDFGVAYSYRLMLYSVFFLENRFSVFDIMIKVY